MKCPQCEHKQSRVIDVRTHSGAERRWRRRECKGCGSRFNTIELHAGKSRNLVPYNAAFNSTLKIVIRELRGLQKKED